MDAEGGAVIHAKRRFAVSVVESAEQLAEKLTEYYWTRCTGFQLFGLLFLNDSFSEDGAQEWAVYRAGCQLDTVTFSWCSRDRALEIIQNLLKREGEGSSGVLPRTEPADQHGSCPLCG